MRFDAEDDYNDELTMIIPSDRTYYVAQTGSDLNSGLSAIAPWATLKHAMDVIGAFLVPSDVTITVQLLDGTIEIADPVVPPIMDGTLIIQGNAATPGNVVLSADGTLLPFTLSGASRLTVKDFAFSSVAAGATGFSVDGQSILNFGNIVFGLNFANIFSVRRQGLVICDANFSITEDCTRFLSLSGQGQFDCVSRVVSLVGAPVWSSEFMLISGGYTRWDGTSFTGSGVGQRYEVNQNGVIFTNGGGANFFPGNVAGATATGGQYI